MSPLSCLLCQREDLPSSPAEPENQSSLSYSEENPRCSTHVRSTPERLTASKLGFPAYLDQDSDYLLDSSVCLTLDSEHVESYFKQEPTFLIPSFTAQVPYLNMDLAHPISFKAASGKASDPDLFSYDEAMQDLVHRSKWMEAAQAEISALETKGTWVEVPLSDAKSKILPGTWVFCVKRSPDGEIRKYKARYCIRGDLQELADDVNTYAPVVSWTTVRMFLVMSMILK